MGVTTVLVLVYLHGYSAYSQAQFQEFNSPQSCEAAKQIVIAGFDDGGDKRKLERAVCVPK
jgi:hypothetical protein